MEPILSAGQLLVAAPALTDPNFTRTVVLMLDHDDAGSLGVVLNRPSRVAVGEVLAPWAPLASDPGVVFRGGPVGLDGALGLAAVGSVPVRPDAGPVGWRPVVGAVGLVDLDTPTEVLGGALRHLRIFAGYAGWGAGQLGDELREGAWIIADSQATDVFATDPDRLWGDVLRRQPGELPFLATRPADPSLN